jgi:NAD(P)-dependent dehydrogenase (short-subunit alcohol dehydrogenase family)
MRVIVVGGTGTIGEEVASALRAAGHAVVRAARSSGDVRVDITSKESIEEMYRSVGQFDALVACAGSGAWKPLEQLTDDDFQASLGNKLMGQVNLVRAGLAQVADGGSFTLTSGVLAQEPIPNSAAVSLVNAALEGFTRAAAVEAPRGVRVNVVSPPWVSETLRAMGQDPSAGMPAAQVARAYVALVEGTQNGAVIDARSFR